MKPDLETADAVAKPILIRAGVALIFGLTTVFVQEPSTPVSYTHLTLPTTPYV